MLVWKPHVTPGVPKGTIDVGIIADQWLHGRCGGVHHMLIITHCTSLQAVSASPPFHSCTAALTSRGSFGRSGHACVRPSHHWDICPLFQTAVSREQSSAGTEVCADQSWLLLSILVMLQGSMHAGEAALQTYDVHPPMWKRSQVDSSSRPWVKSALPSALYV